MICFTHEMVKFYKDYFAATRSNHRFELCINYIMRVVDAVPYISSFGKDGVLEVSHERNDQDFIESVRFTTEANPGDFIEIRFPVDTGNPLEDRKFMEFQSPRGISEMEAKKMIIAFVWELVFEQFRGTGDIDQDDTWDLGLID